MEKDGVNFWKAGVLWLIVKKLTKESVHEAIQFYKDSKPNSYQLNLQDFATEIGRTVFTQLQAQEIKEANKLNFQVRLDDLKTEINKFDNLEKSKKSDLAAS